MRRFKTFNICIDVIFVILVLIFVFFFLTDEESINKDISEKYNAAEILIERDIEDSKIILFSVGETKTGIANYIKLPFVNKYFCQETYVLENSDTPVQEIKDVFRGKWDGYVITATPKYIKLDNVAKNYGIYWSLIQLIITPLALGWFIFIYIEIRAKKT